MGFGTSLGEQESQVCPLSPLLLPSASAVGPRPACLRPGQAASGLFPPERGGVLPEGCEGAGADTQPPAEGAREGCGGTGLLSQFDSQGGKAPLLLRLPWI